MSIFRELRERSNSFPDIAGPHSKLFVLPHSPLAGVMLSISVEKYLELLSKQDDAVKPKKIEFIPTGNEEFPAIIFAPVSILDGKSFIDGREVVLED